MPADPTQTSLFPEAPSSKDEATADKKRLDADPVEELLDPESDQTKLLYQLAVYIQQMAPWNFMSETDVFGFQDPVSEELGFISVMGQLGEYQSIAVYRGVEGLYGWRQFLKTLESDPKSDDAHDLLMEIPQIQLSFGPSSLLEKRDRALIKASGFKFSKNGQPQFRSFRSGYLPWFLTVEEALHLIHALTQTIVIATRFFTDPNLFPVNENVEDRDYLIRTPCMNKSVQSWEESIFTVDPPPTYLTPFGLEDSTVGELNELPRSGPMEVDVFTLPGKVGKSHERPRLIYALLTVDSESEFVLGMELLEATDGVDLMFASLSERLTSQWLENGIVPQEIRSWSKRLAHMLRPVADQLDLSVSLVKKLPALSRAKKSLMAQFR